MDSKICDASQNTPISASNFIGRETVPIEQNMEGFSKKNAIPNASLDEKVENVFRAKKGAKCINENIIIETFIKGSSSFSWMTR
jgi:hypothetical protein